jgi:hypothetical protein
LAQVLKTEKRINLSMAKEVLEDIRAANVSTLLM